jgi:hypothetical protein
VLKRFLPFVPALCLVAGGPALLADTAATVTESVNVVTHGTSQTAGTAPAKIGTKLQDGEYLETGVKSRAELQLANQTVTRLGANTIFNYSAVTNEIDLQSGTILFSKPKDSAPLSIKTAAVTAAIVGTTGFVQVHGKAFLFGLVEGHAKINVAGTIYPLAPGEILRLAPGGKPQTFFFNIPLFLKTTSLISKFHGPLPNQVYIDREVALYDDFASRGFIAPPTEPYFLNDVGEGVPMLPVPAMDSAGNAHRDFNAGLPAPLFNTNGG